MVCQTPPLHQHEYNGGWQVLQRTKRGRMKYHCHPARSERFVERLLERLSNVRRSRLVRTHPLNEPRRACTGRILIGMSDALSQEKDRAIIAVHRRELRLLTELVLFFLL